MFGNKLVIMVVGVLAAVFPFWCVLLSSGLGALEAEVDILQDSGEPVSLEDLREYYPAPDPADGPHPGELYERAFRVMREREARLPGGMTSMDVPASVPARGERWSERVLDREEEYIEHHAESRRILHRAAGMGPAHFEFEFEVGGFTAPPEHLSPARQAIRLLRNEVIWHAHRGRTDDAQESLLAAWGVADALRDEPLIVSYLTRASMLQAAMFATEWLVRDAALSEAQLATLQETVGGRLDGGRALRRAIVGERVIGHTYFEQVTRGERGDDVLGIGPSLAFALRMMSISPRDHAYYLRAAREAIADAERRDPGMVGRWSDEATPSALISGVLTLAFKHVLRADLVLDARTRATVVGLAAARYRLEHGAYPETLDALVPAYLDAVPEDPFDPGQPLRYRRTEMGAIVYSLGPNRTDYGGREVGGEETVALGRVGTETDITFTLGDAQAELWPEQRPE